MKNTVSLADLAAMSIEELEAIMFNAQQTINDKKRESAMKEAVRTYKEVMASLGFSKEEMMAAIDNDGAVISSITEIEPIPDLPETPDEPLALPETTQGAEEVTPIEEQVSIIPENEEDENNVEKTEKELTSLEDLLSDDTEYKEYFAPKHPEKKSDRTLPTMDELLSGEPINMILCMGNLLPKGAPFRQHTRICHANGIIPTETATGQTLIYTPPAPSMAA